MSTNVHRSVVTRGAAVQEQTGAPLPRAPGISKLDIAARLAIAGGVVYLFGPVVGIKGIVVGYGLEKALGPYAGMGSGIGTVMRLGTGLNWICNQLASSRVSAPPTAAPIPSEPQVRQIPIGLKNETGKDSFINAYLQAAVLDDPALMQTVMQTRWTRELGSVVRAYQDGAEGIAVDGAKSVRMTLGRNLSGVYRSGEHDPVKAFQFLHDPRYAPHRNFQTQTIREYRDLPAGMSKDDFKKQLREEGAAMVGEDWRGIHTVRYNPQFDGCTRLAWEEGVSLEKMILNSLKHTSLERMPKTLTFEISIAEGAKTPLVSVMDSVIPDAELFPDKKHHAYLLTSFIRQQEGGCVAYVRRGDQYYECRDDQIRSISKWDFRDAAESGDSIKLVKYSLVD